MSRTETLQFLNLAHFLDHFFLLIFPTAALAIGPAWEMSYGQTLALGAPAYVCFAVGTLPAGWLGDRMDRTVLIALFFLGCGAASLFVAVAENAAQMTIGLGALGLFAAIYHPVGIAMIPDLADRTGRALAVNGVFGNMGLAGAAVATGFLADSFGWRSAFALPGAFSALLGVALLLRRLRSGASEHHSGASSAKPAGDGRSQVVVFAVICVAALFGGLIFNAVSVSLPKFFEERLSGLDGDLALIGAWSGLVFALAAFAQLPVGELLDRYGARLVMSVVLAAQMLLLVLVARLEGWIVLPLSLLLVTMMFAEIPICGWLMGRYVRSAFRSRATAIEYTLSLGMTAAVVPALAAMHEAGFGFDRQFLLLAVSAAVVMIAAQFLPRAGRRAPAPLPADAPSS